MSDATPATPPRARPADGSGRAVRPVDTLLVTGFLGAGKTTLLSGWLAERPRGERWAVLVNEFGALGIDGALLGGSAAGDAAVEVAQVAGGCACCAARVAFGATLTRLLRRGTWDRLLIETTGLGHPAALLDRLREPGLAAHLRLLPPVAVVDASRAGLYLDPARAGHQIAADQVELARLLVLNRCDAAADDATDALAARLAALPPWPRPVIRSATGRAPLAAVLAALAELGSGAHPAGPGPAAGLSARSAALRWPAATAFDRARLQAALEALAAPGGPLRACGLLRGKGVFRTERAWYGWQWVDGRADWREAAWRADNRIELLADRPIDPQMVDKALRTAVVTG